MSGKLREGDIIKRCQLSANRLFPGKLAGPTRAILMRNRTSGQSWLRVFQATTLVIGLLLLFPHARSVEVTELYTVQVARDPENSSAPVDPYRSALNVVLVRITGEQDMAESALLAELFPDASRYVLQYRPGEDNSLWVSLDGTAIENVLRRAGKTVWSNDRPLTMVWLAVDWGQGVREIVSADDSDRSPAEQRSLDRNRQLRDRLQDAASWRGVPVAFPLMDTEDLGKINFSDIWGGFDDRVLQASERYGAEAVLIGRVRPTAAQPYRWTYHLGNEVLEYSGEPAQVINQLANTLVAQFAVAGDVPLETVSLTISGVNSLAAYGAMQSIMADLRSVESFSIETVAGDRIRYIVQVYGGAERLNQALQASRGLEPESGIGRGIDAGGMPQFDSLEFAYRP
jgi:uncharacterized protein